MKKITLSFFYLFIITLYVSADYDFSRFDYIRQIAYSNNGNYIASVDLEGLIKIYDSSTLKIVETFNGDLIAATQLKFSPDDRYLTVASYGIQIFDIETGRIAYEWLPGIGDHSHRITSISYRFDGQKLVSGNRLGIIYVWDIINGIEPMKIDGSSYGYIYNVLFNPDGNNILSISPLGIRLWQADNGTELINLSEDNIPFFFSFTSLASDRSIIISGFSRTEIGTIIEVYNANNFEILFSHTFLNRRIPIGNIFIIPNSFFVIISDYRLEKIIIIDYINGNIVDEFNLSFPVAFSPDGKNIVYSYDKKNINIREINY